jgi:hypothetical protein
MARSRSESQPAPGRRCLIVERHEWETGAAQQQLQFLLETALEFFGPDAQDREIAIRVFLLPAPDPAFERRVVISRKYGNGTRRLNRFSEMGAVPASFVFFEETAEPDRYDVWWQTDKAIVAARFANWLQGNDSQHGRGRLSVIVDAPVPRPISRINADRGN